jgi:hypothetical protein
MLANLDTPYLSSVRNTASFFEFSLCLSRACLGKMIDFIYKWHLKNEPFFAGGALTEEADEYATVNSEAMRCLVR